MCVAGALESQLWPEGDHCAGWQVASHASGLPYSHIFELLLNFEMRLSLGVFVCGAYNSFPRAFEYVILNENLTALN